MLPALQRQNTPDKFFFIKNNIYTKIFTCVNKLLIGVRLKRVFQTQRVPALASLVSNIVYEHQCECSPGRNIGEIARHFDIVERRTY